MHEEIKQYMREDRFSDALNLLRSIVDQEERKIIYNQIIDVYKSAVRLHLNRYRKILLYQNPAILEECEDEEKTQ